MTAPAQAPGVGPACDVDPFGEEFLSDPFPGLAQIRAAGPATYLPRYDVWAVAGYREVHAVLRDHERFSSAPGVGLANLATDPYGWRKPSLLLETDPPVHTRYRALVVGTMTPRALQAFHDVFQTEAGRLVAELTRRERFDAVTDLAELFPTVVFPHALGIEGDTRDRLLAYGALSFDVIGPRNRLLERSIAAADGARTGSPASAAAPRCSQAPSAPPCTRPPTPRACRRATPSRWSARCCRPVPTPR